MTLRDCVYVANPANDGDSFHVKADDKEYIFRLYFVDAPEISSVNAPRLIEQAKYFGITVPEIIELGRAADSYVRDRLSEPFTVITHFAHSPSRGKVERFYAFVKTKDGDDLGEKLIENGFARIFGTVASPPGHAKSAEETAKLTRFENEAKGKKIGGWATSADRLSLQTERTQESNVLNSASSGSKQAVASPPVSSQPTATAAPTTHGLDVNHATRKQLEDLPGIGPVLAARIIAARPMKSADDLQYIDGIGQKKYAAIRPFFD